MTLIPIRRVGLVLLIVLGLSIVIWAVYSPILYFNFTGWDTLAHVKTASERVPAYTRFFTEPLTANGIWYRPVSGLSYGINFTLWGLDPFAYHMTDLMLHWVVVMGVFVLGYQGTGRLWAGVLGAFAFALNPILPTTVLNIAQRHDTLMTAGTIWALVLLYTALHVKGWKRGAALVGAWLAFGVAVGAKETGLVALPLVLWMSWRYRELLTGSFTPWWQSAPFVLIAMSYVAARQMILHGVINPNEGPDTLNLQLAPIYLQESILPRLGPNIWGWLGFSIFLIAIVILCLPVLRKREWVIWLGLFGIWISIPLLLYLATGVEEFRNRYAYIMIAPLTLLIVRLLAVPLEPPTFDRQNLAPIAAKAVLGITLVAWLPLGNAQVLPRGLVEREIGAGSYLEELDRVAAELPDATVLDLNNVPSKLVYRDSIQVWLDLKWRDKRLQVGEQQTSPNFRGRAALTLTPLGQGTVRIDATYLPISEQE